MEAGFIYHCKYFYRIGNRDSSDSEIIYKLLLYCHLFFYTPTFSRHRGRI